MLEAHHLTKRYGELLALDRLDLKVEPGEIYCLLGPNGAGKTTTINLFLGFLQPTEGNALVDGVPVHGDLFGARAKLAYIPEQVHLYPEMTARENLGYLLTLSQHPDLSRGTLETMLVEAGLPADCLDRKVQEFSKGMRQKVGIALALARKARVLLLDEPTSGLDPGASNDFARTISRLAENGSAVLMVTHDLFRAKQTGHRIGIMKRGRLLKTLASDSVDHATLESIYLEEMATLA